MTRQASAPHRQRGVSLIETLIATGICATVMVAIASLIATATQQSKNMGSSVSQATALAAQKVDQLMTMQFTSGSTAAPLACSGGASSPCGSIDTDTKASGWANASATATSNYVEYLDGSGTALSGATSSTSSGVFFTRRWSITNTTSSLITIQVIVIAKTVGTGFAPSVTMACMKAKQ